MSEAVCIFLAALGSTLRVCQQVPPQEYSPEIFLRILVGNLDWRGAPQKTVGRLRKNQGELNEMMSALRQMYDDPILLLLDPPEGPPN